MSRHYYAVQDGTVWSMNRTNMRLFLERQMNAPDEHRCNAYSGWGRIQVTARLDAYGCRMKQRPQKSWLAGKFVVYPQGLTPLEFCVMIDVFDGYTKEEDAR